MKAIDKNAEAKILVERGYDQVAHEYAKLECEKQWPRLKWLKKLLDRLPPGSSVLDLGCGSGHPADIEIARLHHVTGIDISAVQVDLARQNVPAGRFIHGDMASMDFPEQAFDAVVSFYTIEHIPREEHFSVLKKIYHWIKPGGWLLFSMEAEEYEEETGQWLGVPMFLSSFGPEVMKSLVVQTGFELIESAVEIQVENKIEIPYLWVLGLKQALRSTE